METNVQTDSTAPTRAHWWMAATLCVVNAVAFIDRTALPLLIQPMKRSLDISDTQISLLIGAAFTATYTLGGIVIGALVDRVSRRATLSAGIGVWGLATMFCGTASTFASLFVGRCGVGVGESACGPSRMSLIHDTFPPRYRGRAIAIWSMGVSLGAGSALIAGGAILYLIGDAASIALPILGATLSWQVVLCVAASLPAYSIPRAHFLRLGAVHGRYGARRPTFPLGTSRQGQRAAFFLGWRRGIGRCPDPRRVHCRPRFRRRSIGAGWRAFERKPRLLFGGRDLPPRCLQTFAPRSQGESRTRACRLTSAMRDALTAAGCGAIELREI
jgi:MFS family permease